MVASLGAVCIGAADVKPIGIGIVGVGTRGTLLLRTLLDFTGVEIAAFPYPGKFPFHLQFSDWVKKRLVCLRSCFYLPRCRFSGLRGKTLFYSSQMTTGSMPVVMETRPYNHT